jgi:asparagine synthase (glutamine-hydrolysing)
LVKIDRATMFYGIEAREPFIDHRLVEFAAQIPGSLKLKDGKSKYLLKKLLERYIPQSLILQQKRGFSIPIFSWFSQELDLMFEENLSPDALRTVPFLNVKAVQRELKKYQSYKVKNQEYNIEKLWRILSFILWHKKWG